MAVVLCLVINSPQSVFAEKFWTLQAVVRQAREETPEVRVAALRMQVAKAQLAQANSALWPHFQLQSGYLRTDSPVQSFGNILNQRSFSSSIDFNDVPITDNFVGRGMLSFPLYVGGQNSARIDGARAHLRAMELQEEVVARDYAVQAASTFFEIVKAREVMKSVESSVRAFEANEKAVRARFDSGAALKTELLEVQVQLEHMREELVRASNGHSLLVESLKSLLVVDGEAFKVSLEPVELIVPEGDSASSQRLEVQAVQSEVHAAEARVREAHSGYLPRVSLQGGYEYDKGWELHGDGTNYTVGVVGEWDVFNGHQTQEQKKEANLELQAVQEGKKRLQKVVDLEKVQARMRVEEARDALKITKKAEKIALESAVLTRLRFLQGLTTSTQLIDVEHALTNASVRRARADADSSIAIIMLRRALNLFPIDLER
ncbi:MAG: TolC family protein [Bdellovibrionales bacterium]|nr:TolC family protein [Bdellovibrionales bacterium]